MNNSIYKILNHEAKSWWYHRDLRKTGQDTKARKLERKSILGHIKNIKDVLKYGGYLSLGRCQWSLEVFEHASSSGLGTTKYSLQGYYNQDKSCYLEDICKRLGIPIKDSRLLTENEAWEYIKLPMVGKTKDFQDENEIGSMNYVNIKTFVKLASEKFSNFKHYNIERI